MNQPWSVGDVCPRFLIPSQPPPFLRLFAASLTLLLSLTVHQPPRAAEPTVLAGPAMGTTYRVTLAASLKTLSRGEVHRELEVVLARIDAAASTWRADSSVSRFNAGPADEWIPVADDLAAIVEIAQSVHEQTEGRFDITVSPLIELWSQAHAAGREPSSAAIAAAMADVGMQHLTLRRAADGSGKLRKARPGLTLNLGGIGPGYAVDCLGARLERLGSAGHLVVLGGEARAWGTQADGSPWEVQLPHFLANQTAPASGHVRIDQGAAQLPAQPLLLASGEAIAFSTPRPGRSPINPRTGRPVRLPPGPVMARASSCATADARAVATAVALAVEQREAFNDGRGVLSVETSPSPASTKGRDPAR